MISFAFDEVFNVIQLRNEGKGKLTNLVSSDSGLFFFYSEDGELLFIGWSKHGLPGSIGEYLVGRAGNARSFYSDIYTVKILYSDSFEAFRDTYQDCSDIQFYLIDKLNPKFNVVSSLKNAYVDSERYIDNQYKEWESMKILMKPIEVLAWFENGIPHPIRLKRNGKETKIEQVVSTFEEKLVGNRMLCFRCQSEIDGELKPFEIKFELNTCKWFLYKM